MPENSFPGETCVRNRPIHYKDKILLLPLHIKLGLIKNFVKAMNKQSKGFGYLREKLPKVSDVTLSWASLLDGKFMKS